MPQRCMNRQLVAQHLAGGADLALEAVALAQQPRLREGPAVAELREHQRHELERAEIGRQDRDVGRVREPCTPSGTPRATSAVALGLEARQAHQQRLAVGDRVAVGERDPEIIGRSMPTPSLMSGIDAPP